MAATVDEAAKEMESKLRELSAAAELDADFLAGLVSLQFEQFSDASIVVHWIGEEFVPDWFRNETKSRRGRIGAKQTNDELCRIPKVRGTNAKEFELSSTHSPHRGN